MALITSFAVVSHAEKVSANELNQAGTLNGQIGSQFNMRKSVIASGQQAQGEGYVINGAIGQPLTGQSAGGNFQLNAGFYRGNRDLIFSNEFETFNFN
ncbi:hypothetical protein OS175_01610 [Marinicella sp. S1101]|uniref:hypothetical protein n=1 Tax=Marinicella marina TaxID=2996016 RepID=UPI002260FED5|nr:hypothetical protein [Marinicella marina]MCX7552559.1 hypothetical protein [Marinicella marina]MDJ1139435.1 hypothetical protein [Marinicella marina]